MPFVWGAAIGAVGSLASSAVSSSAAQNAADTQANAANSTAAMQQGMYNQNQANLKPYNSQGQTALSTLTGDMSNGTLGGQFTGADYLANKDPGYQFQLQQGNQALQNSQAAQDGVMSGSALKGLINYNQGAASTGYQNAYNRWLTSQQNTYGQLSGVASLGENAAAQAGNTGANYANSIGNTITSGANAAASGIVGSANAISGGISGASGSASNYLLLNSLMSNGNTGSLGSNVNAGSTAAGENSYLNSFYGLS